MVQIFPICSGAKEPVKAIVQSKVGIQACEIHTEIGRVYVRNRHHLRKSQEPFYINFPGMSFKGMASSTMDNVNSSLNFKEQHVTEHTTVFPATASEQKPRISLVPFNLYFHCFQGQGHCYVTIPTVSPANQSIFQIGVGSPNQTGSPVKQTASQSHSIQTT